jgi:hypothetical protein
LSIEFSCSCGRALRVRDESLRGRKVRCPACGALTDVPGAPPSQRGQNRNSGGTGAPRGGRRRRKRRPRKRSSQKNGQGGGKRRARRSDRTGRLQPQERQPVEVGGGLPPSSGSSRPAEPAKKAGEVEQPAQGPVRSFFKRLFGK